MMGARITGLLTHHLVVEITAFGLKTQERHALTTLKVLLSYFSTSGIP